MSPPENPKAISEEKEDSPARMLTKKQAGNIALKRVKGTITDIDLDEDDGRWIYEIEIQAQGKEYEVGWMPIGEPSWKSKSRNGLTMMSMMTMMIKNTLNFLKSMQ